MLYLDGISISKVKNELKNTLQRKRVGKIFQNSALSLSLYFGKTSLFFSCNPSLPICYINEEKEENLVNESSNFLILLRKYLVNSELIDIEQIGFDRILRFKFLKLNELGERKEYYLYFEIMGKHSNLILVDEENKIVSLLKKFTLVENSFRLLFPGAEYQQPIIENKVNPSKITEKDFTNFMNNGLILENIEGIGKKTSMSLNSYQDFKNLLISSISPKIYFKNNTPVLATVLNLKVNNFDKIIEYSTFSDLVNNYIKLTNVSNSFNLLKNTLVICVEKEINNCKKILKNIEKDIVVMSEFDKYKKIADVLASVLYSIKKGDKEVKAYDFYENKEILIVLDPLLNPQGNLNKIYKKSSKMKRGLEISKERKVIFTQKIIYLESVLGFIEKTFDLEGLKNIEIELIEEKILKLERKKSKHKNKLQSNYGIIIIDNKNVFYGRNNKENDFLTFKFAKKDDIWFHVKDISGSHFIVKKEDFVNDKVFIEKVATYASFYSKASKGEKVVVEYTEKKNLNKPKNSPLGFVTYNTAKTIIVSVPETI